MADVRRDDEEHERVVSKPTTGYTQTVRPAPMEYGESRLTMEWRQMTQEERIEEALLAFEKNIEEVEQTRNPAHLRSAASSLSVMKADLCATPEGRKLYKRMESRYDELEDQLHQ